MPSVLPVKQNLVILITCLRNTSCLFIFTFCCYFYVDDISKYKTLRDFSVISELVSCIVTETHQVQRAQGRSRDCSRWIWCHTSCQASNMGNSCVQGTTVFNYCWDIEVRFINQSIDRSIDRSWSIDRSINQSINQSNQYNTLRPLRCHVSHANQRHINCIYLW